MKNKLKNKLFAGIDVGKDKHRIVVKDENYEITESFEFKTNHKGFGKLERILPVSAVIGLEATNEYDKPLVSFLRMKGYEVYVFNPRKTKSFARINHIATKTDKVDAKILADFMVIGIADARDISSYNSEMGLYKTQMQAVNKYPEIKQLTRARLKLIHDQNKYKHRVLNRLCVVFPEYEHLFSENFGVTFTRLLEKYTYPENFSVLDAEKLGKEMIKLSKGILREDRAKKIIETARQSVGVRNEIEGYIEEIRINLKYIQELEKDIKRLDRKIRERMMNVNQKLTTIKGINVSLAATIISEIGDIEKFKNRRALFNFTGMVPGIKQTGKYERNRNHMSKHGSKYLRTAIWQAAISCINHNKVFRMYFIKKHSIDKKQKMTAVGAVCRKLTYQIYRIMRYDEGFDMEKAVQVSI